MSWYPFDTQDCYAKLGVSNGDDFIELVRDQMKYIGGSDVMKSY